MEEHWIDKADELHKDKLKAQINEKNQRIDELESLLKHQEKSESTYRSIFQNMDHGYAYHKIIEKNGKPCDFIFLEFNKAFEEILGLKRETIIGKRVTEALPGIDKYLEDWIEIYGKVALNEESVTLEQYSAQLKKWFSILVFCPMKDYFVTVFTDITKQVEERQVFEKQSTIGNIRLRRLENILNSTGEGIYSLNVNGDVIYINASAAKILGYEIEELKGKKIHQLIHYSKTTESGNEECHACAPLLDGSVSTASDEKFRKKDGESVPVDFISSPIFNEKNQIGGIVVTFKDISNREEVRDEFGESDKRFKDLLIASENRFQALFDKMESEIQKGNEIAQMYLDIVGVAIIAVDNSGRVTLVNKKGCEILGYEEEEIVGNIFSAIFVPKHERANAQVIFDKLITGEIESIEHVESAIIAKSSEERIISWRHRVITDESGEINGILSSGTDITKLKRSEEALKQSLKNLSSTLRS